MAKVSKEIQIQSSEELASLEIIEMAIDDIATLARAFDVINHVCSELQSAVPAIETSCDITVH